MHYYNSLYIVKVFQNSVLEDEVLDKFKDYLFQSKFMNPRFINCVINNELTFHVIKKIRYYYEIEAICNDINYLITNNKTKKSTTNFLTVDYNYIDKELYKNDLARDRILFDSSDMTYEIDRSIVYKSNHDYFYHENKFKKKLSEKIKSQIRETNKIKKNSYENSIDIGLLNNYSKFDHVLYIEEGISIEFSFENKKYSSFFSLVTGKTFTKELPRSEDFNKYSYSQLFNTKYITNKIFRTMFLIDKYEAHLLYKEEIKSTRPFFLYRKIKKFYNNDSFSESLLYSKIGYYELGYEFCLKGMIKHIESMVSSGEYTYYTLMYYSLLLSRVSKESNERLAYYASKGVFVGFFENDGKVITYYKKASKMGSSDASIILYKHYQSYEYYNRFLSGLYLKRAAKQGNILAKKLTNMI